MILSTKLPKVNGHQGFALISTISIMVLMVMMALAMVSLSTVELRSAQNDQAMAEARANARMAAMIALARLQQLAGPDTRVTAPANIINDQAYPLTGVWRSWEGLDHKNTGEPIIPAYDLKNANGSPTDETDRNRFLGWLVSGQPYEVFDVAKIPDLSRADGKITLVGQNTTGTAIDKDQVHVRPSFSGNNQRDGAIAWWVAGQNQKAQVAYSKAPTGGADEWNARLKSHGYPNAEHFHLANDPDLDKVATNQTYDVAPEFQGTPAGTPADQNSNHFHDLTAWSRGLLTNTATGGWRRDLSLMSEKWDDLPAGEGTLPFFTLKPGEFTTASKSDITGATHPQSMLIFPWEAPGAAPGLAWRMNTAVVTWNAMKDFATQYKQIDSSDSSGKVIFTPQAYTQLNNSGHSQRLNTVRRYPNIVRIQWVYSYSAIKDGEYTEDAQGDPLDAPIPRYRACVIANPVLTLWNPYNFGITLTEQLKIQTEEPSPISFTFSVGNSEYPAVTFNDIAFLEKLDAAGNSETKKARVTLFITGTHTFMPGETRVYSSDAGEPVDREPAAAAKNQSLSIRLTEGLRTKGGIRYSQLHKDFTTHALTPIYGRAGDNFSVSLKFDGKVKQNSPNVGLLMNFSSASTNKMGAHRMEISKEDAVDNNFYPGIGGPDDDDQDIGATTLVGANTSNQPFGSATFGFRMAQNARFRTKGTLQTNPLTFYTELGIKNSAVLVNGALGKKHPANSPYDFSFKGHVGWGDNALPEADPSSHRGYIISGSRSGTGLERCIMAEIPTSPLQSLAELSQFDIRNNNALPPFILNPIANSEASPLFPPNEVRHNNHLQYDTSYISNHLLFDDWYVSSIAPDTAAWSSNEDRDIETVYSDFISGASPLPNQRYLPASPIAQPETEDIDKAINQSDSYHTIASRIVVDGMFNINSTSKEAWLAILGHLKNVQVPSLTETSNSWEVQLLEERDHPVSRFTVASDGTPNDSSSSGGTPFPNEFAGHRNLTDDHIDALAEEIIKQIKRRGPYLSLSEFINRRLTDDVDLALAGTIQAALDEMAKLSDAAKNPYKVLQDETEQTTISDPGDQEDEIDYALLDYQFPEAAEGYTAYGVPGWIRQADILRPLAPILSARDDTFLIRAYGDARDAQGNITARAWCELVVQRKAEYIDGTDDPTDHPALKEDSQYLQSQANERFGRRFDIMSIRWLSADEI